MKNLFLILMLLACLSCLLGKGQDSLKGKNRIYYGVTLGSFFSPGQQVSDDIAVCGMMDLYVRNDNYSITTAFHYLIDFNILGNDPLNSITSLDAMFGKVLLHNKMFSNISSGIGFVFLTKNIYKSNGYADFNQVERNTAIGIPLSAKLSWQLIPIMGVGVDIYANINRSSFYDLSITYELGKLRSKIPHSKTE